MDNKSTEAYKTLSSLLKYKGKIFRVYSDSISLPDGKSAVREFVDRGGAAAIVAVGEDGKLVFVRQYRHALGTMTLELPAGTLETGEEPELCAMRELEEEIGQKTNKLTLLTKMYPSVGICNEYISVYLADTLSPGVQKLDPDEFIELEYYTLEEALAMIDSGEITDAKTVIA
ncbi:MAG: NUDIX hydrolase, partial [Firmicutes bacterium]|nr:NUDIX hydrolase [Bacillota bacterium]